jgi:hypothetical protein
MFSLGGRSMHPHQQKAIHDSEKTLEILKTRVRLDFTLDDVRNTLGCFRAVAYQAKIDDEPYLDSDALALKSRLESLYKRLLLRATKEEEQRHEGKGPSRLVNHATA